MCFFIKLERKFKFSFKLILDLVLSLDLISLQIKLFNPRNQFKLYIQFILNHLPMIHTIQLFDLIKSNFKNLMNLSSLQCNSHSK